jgi:hypothetical protein
MSTPTRAATPHRRPFSRALLALAGSAALASACGGGAFDNPATIANPQGSSNGQRLSFAYFQRCVMPVLKANLPVDINGTVSINSCASAGCHDNATGTGGALRLLRDAADVDLADPALAADAIRATEMYRNFYSAQGESVIGAPLTSRLINKPLVRGVLHGGGLIFANEDDPNAKRLRYWITHPMPAGQDEFSTAASNLFTPADIGTGACNTD